MPFDNAIWPPVAKTPEQRHDTVGPAPAADGTDWPTSGGGPTPLGFGEGWRLLGPDEIVRDGDEVGCVNGVWYPAYVDGLRVGTLSPHRRRVTPVPPELSPAAVSAMCQRNERAALLAKNATLKAESDQQQEIILHAGLEIERLKAEVERLRLTAEERIAIAFFNNAWPLDTQPPVSKTLHKFLNRLGGGE